MSDPTTHRAPYGGNPPSVPVDTSIEAAEQIKPHVSRIAADVLTFIIVSLTHGATCDEVERWLLLSHQTASARIRELYLKGRIKDSGQRRKTGSGRNAIVWVATELEKAA